MPAASDAKKITAPSMSSTVAIRPIGIRFLLPILLSLYLAPVVAGPDRVARVLARRRPPAGPGASRGSSDRSPMKNVTPPDERPPDA